MKGKIFTLFTCASALLIASCGTIATPEWAAEAQETRAALLVTTEYQTSIAPTATLTPLPPTATFTALPPTATLPPPTETPIPPTETPAPPTEVPTEEPAASEGGIPDPSTIGDPANGQAIFTMGNSMGAIACTTCHFADRSDNLVGPGMWNIAERAGDLVPGLDAVGYIQQSILDPNAYVAQGFAAGLMPATYAQQLSEQEVNDLTAYLLTLHD